MNEKDKSRIEKTIEISVLTSIIFIPIFISISVLSAVIALIFLLLHRGMSTFRINNRPFKLALSAVIIAVLLSSILAQNKSISLISYAGFLLYPLIFFLSINLERKKILKFLFIGGIITLLFSLIQWLTGYFPSVKFHLFGKIPVSISGLSLGMQKEKANALARFLVLTLPISISFIISNKNIKNRITGILFAIMGIVLLFPLKSLGAIISLSILVIFSLLIYKRKFGLILILLISVLILLYPDLPVKIFTKCTSYSGVKVKINTWNEVSRKVIERNPVTGYGIGCYNEIVKDIKREKNLLKNHPHNFYIYLFSESGGLGFISMISLIILSLYLSFKRGRKDILSTGASFGILGLLLHGFVSSFLEYIPVGMILWINMGIIINESGSSKIAGHSSEAMNE